MKNLSWFSPQTADEFFPRCYKLSHEDDKIAFIDDYRITCCIGLLKYVLIKHNGEPDEDDLDVHITSAEELNKMKEAEESKSNENKSEQQTSIDILPFVNSNTDPVKSQNKPRNFFLNLNSKSFVIIIKRNLEKSVSIRFKSKSKPITKVPLEAIDFAIDQLNAHLDFCLNNDIDRADSPVMNEDKWSQFYSWFYAACQ